MKNKILTLAAAGLLAQTNFASESKNSGTSASIDTGIATSINSQKVPGTVDIYTPQVPADSSSKRIKPNTYSLETIMFQNKKHPNKTYEVTLPTTQRIRFKDWKAENKSDTSGTLRFFRPGSTWSYGIITHINDSLVTVKYQTLYTSFNMRKADKNKTKKTIKEFRLEMKKKGKEYANEIRKLKEDRTLSDEEKENKYFELTYTDSIQIPLSHVKSIAFSRFNTKNNKFHITALGWGMKEQRKSALLVSLPLIAAAEISFLATPIAPIAAILLFEGLVYSALYQDFITRKHINFKRWELKNQ